MATERERFEAAAFAYYTGLKAAGWSHYDEGDLTRESLFWLQPNGQYGVTNLNAAWWAWQAAKQDIELVRLTMSAVVIGKFNYLSSTYYVWKEAGRKGNAHPFYFGLTKDRNDIAPNCAYSSITSLLRTHAMHRVTVNLT